MVIYKMKDYEAMSRKAASILAAQITLKPDPRLNSRPADPRKACTASSLHGARAGIWIFRR